jgi:hypothetical protein
MDSIRMNITIKCVIMKKKRGTINRPAFFLFISLIYYLLVLP